MKQFSITEQLNKASKAFEDGYDYLIDSSQRSVLFWDIMRKRGNGYLEHLHMKQPPVLVFDYEVISDGRKRDKPVNYQLVRISGFKKGHDVNHDVHMDGSVRQNRKADKSEDAGKRTTDQQNKRPIVVIDPRAGHGPGIGGSKMDSQIGVALNAGYPVYFMIFFMEPVPGQTIADVQQCQIHFLEEIKKRHPSAPLPAVIGNCQAGWAASLIAADRPDVTGPLVLNGSPLSYWGGVVGGHPMRYRGGLFGGGWLASLAADVGNGKFDGALLVAGFEELNPANTFWTKQYNLYSKVDTEEQRFLDFEKWWGGFFLMSREEIRFIVSHLFISDELEQGFLKLHDGKYINLKNFKSPILVFASKGDNITPPQQALNWIAKVYKTTEEIKKLEQVIIYMLHEEIGHLGIFVSSKVNRKEHKEIIGCVEAIEYLSPGLYEMVIQEDASEPWMQDHGVKFVERDISDILALDDGWEDEEAFQSVSSISSFNDRIYQDFMSPFVRAISSEFSADFVRQLNPLRMDRYLFSDMNPMISPVKNISDMVKENRYPTKEDNIFSSMEKIFSDIVVNSLDFYKETRDNLYETIFYTMYGNDWAKTLFFKPEKETGKSDDEIKKERSSIFEEIESEIWLSAMKKGGFEEAIVRIIVAVSRADNVMDMNEFKTAESYIRQDERLRKIKSDIFRKMIKEQSAILEKNHEQALSTLADLLPDKEDRFTAIEIANAIGNASDDLKQSEIALLKKIEIILLKDEFSFGSASAAAKNSEKVDLTVGPGKYPKEMKSAPKPASPEKAENGASDKKEKTEKKEASSAGSVREEKNEPVKKEEKKNSKQPDEKRN